MSDPDPPKEEQEAIEEEPPMEEPLKADEVANETQDAQEPTTEKAPADHSEMHNVEIEQSLVSVDPVHEDEETAEHAESLNADAIGNTFLDLGYDNLEELSSDPDVYQIKTVFSSEMYVDSQYDLRSKPSFMQSLFSPPSWSSGGDLARQSSAYPDTIPRTPERSDTTIESVPCPPRMGKPRKIKPKPSFPPDDIFQIDQCLDFLYQPKKCPSICTCTSSTTVTEPISIKLEPPNYNIPYLEEQLRLPIPKDVLVKCHFVENLVVSYCPPPDPDRKEDQFKNCFRVLKGSQKYPDLFRIDKLKSLGGMCINIDYHDNILNTYATSQFSYGGKGVSSSLMSIVDHHLHLMEEKRIESICGDPEIEEKTLHVVAEPFKFIAHRTDRSGKEVKRYRNEICLHMTGDFVLDGASFLLMRYLILSNYHGQVETYSMYVTGDMCRNIYCCGHKEWFRINNTDCELIRIRRSMFRHNLKPDVATCWFLPSGHLIQMQWSNFPYVIHINPFTPIPPRPVILNLHTRWEEDIQLMSHYMDFKDQLIYSMSAYLQDCPEVKALIKDYILCLLHLKPNHVLDYTINYFINLGIKTENLNLFNPHSTDGTTNDKSNDK